MDFSELLQDPQMLEDKDLYEKIYSEIEVSKHAVMLKGLPKHIAALEM